MVGFNVGQTSLHMYCSLQRTPKFSSILSQPIRQDLKQIELIHELDIVMIGILSEEGIREDLESVIYI